MKRFILLAEIFVLTFCSFNIHAQKRIAVIGSSTAFGYFAGQYPRDSGFVFLLSKYYKDLGQIDTIYNIAISASDCYQGMPTGYQPPPGRNVPNPSYNVTRAISFNPKPDVLLVCYPSNNYGILSDDEILFCLDSIRKYALANGVKCFITSTQPRDDYWSFEGGDGLCRLKHVNDLIMNYFGENAIDFYTGIATPECKRKPEFALKDDFIHLNPAGHRILEQRVIDKNILLNVVALDFIDFRATVSGNSVLIAWKISQDGALDHFDVKRSRDGVNFQNIGEVGGSGFSNYQFIDQDMQPGKYFYKISAVEKTGHTYQSQILAAAIHAKGLQTGQIFINGNKLKAEILNAPTGKISLSLIDMTGREIFRNQMNISAATFEKNIETVPSGMYVLVISSGNDQVKKILKKL